MNETKYLVCQTNCDNEWVDDCPYCYVVITPGTIKYILYGKLWPHITGGIPIHVSKYASVKRRIA